MSQLTTNVRDEEWMDKVRDHLANLWRGAADYSGNVPLLVECLTDAVRQSRWDDARFYARELKSRVPQKTPAAREVDCLLIRLASK